MCKQSAYTLLVVFLVIIAFFLSDQHRALAGDDNLIVEIVDLDDRDIVVEAFTLKKNLLIEIEAMGREGTGRDEFFAHGWILDSDTRKVIWDFNSESARVKRKRTEIRLTDEILLAKGNYEVYYAKTPHFYCQSGWMFKNFINKFQNEIKYSKRWGIQLFCAEGEADLQYVKLTRPVSDDQTIIQMIEMGNNCYQTQGFSLSQGMDLHIYAIGEGDPKKREMFDYAWIVDAQTRKRVWEMKAQHTRHAGGTVKNRILDDIISLPGGDYLVHYVSDDSHSCEEWNSMPPYDPRYWGITIWGTSVQENDSFIKPYEETEDNNFLIIEITRMRDNEFESQGFSLDRSTNLRIYALGESSSRRKMADYGWIIDAHSREKVWEMKYSDSRHAGGGHKNRLFDGTIVLPAGDYIAYYVTDDSHSYRDWNVGPPYKPEAWGLTIWGADGDFSQDWVKTYHEDEDPAIIAQIIRVGDDEKIKEKFTLLEKNRVQIYAIGEGNRSGMHDYGWIENSRGRVIWKMKYRDTSHAGGARKNREFKDEITLKAGSYYLMYKTDDSHSYHSWNMSAPDDPVHWGITLLRR